MIENRPKMCSRCENPIYLDTVWYRLQGVGVLCEKCVDAAYNEAINDAMGW